MGQIHLWTAFAG